MYLSIYIVKNIILSYNKLINFNIDVFEHFLIQIIPLTETFDVF